MQLRLFSVQKNLLKYSAPIIKLSIIQRIALNVINNMDNIFCFMKSFTKFLAIKCHMWIDQWNDKTVDAFNVC